MIRKDFKKNDLIHFTLRNLTSVGVMDFDYIGSISETRHNMLKLDKCWCANNNADYGVSHNVLIDLDSSGLVELRETTTDEKSAFSNAVSRNE